MNKKSFALLLLCFTFTGCDFAKELTLTPTEKFNAAFPLKREVLFSADDLRALLATDSDKLNRFELEYRNKLELRALSCLDGTKISRFDRIADLQQIDIKQQCLSEQDTKLQEFLALSQIDIELSQPALRPQQKLGRQQRLGNVVLGDVSNAANANVAIVRQSQGELHAIELPSGQDISVIAGSNGNVQNMNTSPNGRLLAFNTYGADGIQFASVKSGNLLGKFTQADQFYVWLPQISAALIREKDSNQLMLMDFQSKEMTPHPMPVRGVRWALALNRSQVLLGDSSQMTLVEYRRDNKNIHAQVLREYRTDLPQYSRNQMPLLMQEGKALLYFTERDLGKLNLETGQFTRWPSRDFLRGTYAKIDENNMLLDTMSQDGRTVIPRLLNIQQGTIATISAETQAQGELVPMQGRNGFFRRQYQQLWLGDQITIDTTESFIEMLDKFNLERQISRLEAMSAEQEYLQRRQAIIQTPTPLSANQVQQFNSSRQMELRQLEEARARSQEIQARMRSSTR